MPIEIITEENIFGDRILGQKIKSADTESTIAVLDSVIKKKIQDFAIETFRALGGRDYGRIDIRFNKNAIPHFLVLLYLYNIDGLGYNRAYVKEELVKAEESITF
jgi:D-alanine-D-alanine ligase-like ATP-grasp enzyme